MIGQPNLIDLITRQIQTVPSCVCKTLIGQWTCNQVCRRLPWQNGRRSKKKWFPNCMRMKDRLFGKGLHHILVYSDVENWSFSMKLLIRRCLDSWDEMRGFKVNFIKRIWNFQVKKLGYLRVCGHVTKPVVLLNSVRWRIPDEKSIESIWISFIILK